MPAENFRGFQRERAVHVNWQDRDAARLRELEQRVEQLLRSADGERRDDDLAVAFDGPVDDLANPVIHVVERLVNPAAVGTFGQQEIHILWVIGII